MSIEFRAASPDDVDAITANVVAVAHHAYADLEPRRVALLDPDDERGEWKTRLGPESDDDVIVVATLGGSVVGVAAWVVPRGPRRLPVANGTLTHLLVHPAAQNAGVGSGLLIAAETALRELRGPNERQTAQLALHRENWWAARFLAARGWTRDEETPADVLPSEYWRRVL